MVTPHCKLNLSPFVHHGHAGVNQPRADVRKNQKASQGAPFHPWGEQGAWDGHHKVSNFAKT